MIKNRSHMVKRIISIASIALAVCLGSCNLIDMISLNDDGDIRIFHFSDTHFEEIDHPVYGEIQKQIEQAAPDIIIFTGDLISANTDSAYRLAEETLRTFPDDIPKFAVLGNWEYWCHADLDRLRELYTRCGFRLLRNEGETISINSMELYVYGYDDLLAAISQDPPASEIGEYNLFLGHEPLIAEDLDQTALPEANNLFFAGHTHGGQITLFGAPLFVPEGSGDYLKGHYPLGKVDLYVSKGIGFSTVDIRMFSSPDVIVTSIRN